MTREEAIKIIKKWLMEGTYGLTENRLGYIEGWFHKEDAEAFEMAIKALEQKPILDKIRAEIEQITDTVGVSYYPKENFMKKRNKPENIEVTKYVNRINVLQIINKYRIRSKETNNK